MKKLFVVLLLILQIAAYAIGRDYSPLTIKADEPIRLHPQNPHYFLYKGSSLALVTSGEHYGAVLNLDFDYKKYLETLSGDGMNYTRIFTGSYFEISGESFGIQNNTLAPFPDKVITPWTKISSDGDKAKYDLDTWNEAYFARLKDFVQAASEKDIIVEVTLFSSIYRKEHWELSPLNPENNINIKDPLPYYNAQTLDNGELLKYQEQFVRKMVTELNGFNNFFFEIQNEPWSDHAVAVYNIVNKEELNKNDWTYKADMADQHSMAWQEKIASTIVDEEGKLSKKHLIAQNYTNFRASVPLINSNISIINFHYAWPDAVEWNYHYDRVIGFDESGFAGSGDQVYRRQAWQFMLSGGGLFNNLDYSFYPGHEDGLGENNAPGGGSKALRSQLNVLSRFLHGFELEKLRPNCTCVYKSPGLIPYILSDKNNTYAIYLRATGTGKTTLVLNTGKGKYRIQTLDPHTGSYSKPIEKEAKNGALSIEIELPEGELAMKIEKN